MKTVKLERVYFSTIANRLGAKIHMETSIDQVNILVCGWIVLFSRYAGYDLTH